MMNICLPQENKERKSGDTCQIVWNFVFISVFLAVFALFTGLFLLVLAPYWVALLLVVVRGRLLVLGHLLGLTTHRAQKVGMEYESLQLLTFTLINRHASTQRFRYAAVAGLTSLTTQVSIEYAEPPVVSAADSEVTLKKRQK